MFLALLVGPLALLVSTIAPAARATSVAAALFSLVFGGVALGALPAAETPELVRRRRLALAVVVVALVSMFLIARTAG